MPSPFASPRPKEQHVDHPVLTRGAASPELVLFDNEDVVAIGPLNDS